LNLGLDEDAVIRECIGLLLDGNPPLHLLKYCRASLRRLLYAAMVG
jgi:hypothetical protein